MRTVRGLVLIALVSVTSFAVSTPAFAQSTDQGIGVGALGGINITSPTGENSEGVASGTGWIFGIWFGGNRNGRVGFMGEVNFAEKKVVDEVDSDTYLSNKVIQIPALARVNVGSRTREGLSVYGLIGPNFDFRLSSKLVFLGEEVPETELENTFSSVDIGIMAGVGVEWNRLGFEFRYSWGLKQLATDEAVEAGVLLPEKTNQMQFVAKFRFN
jgi:opacity protein-like surface antigen